MNKNCKYEKSCGSCQFLSVSYDKQLQLKKEIVENNLKGINCEVLPTIGTFYPYKYRNKLHLAFARERGKVSIGFYEEESKKVVDIDDCILHDEWASKLIAALRKYIAASKIEIFDNQNQTGNLRYAVARFLDGSLMLTLVIYQKFITGIEFLYADLQKEFSQVGIYFNINQTKTSAVFSDKFIHKKGIKKQDAKMLGVHFQLMPQTFYQINQSIATKIYSQVINLLQAKKGQIVLDLYSGIGISSLLLAKSGAQIISIEVVPESVNEAKRLASANHIKNIQFFCGKCEDILPTLSQQQDETVTSISNQKELTVFLDPPRKGCGETVINALLTLAPQKIIYLSCNPITLAQDLIALLGLSSKQNILQTIPKTNTPIPQTPLQNPTFSPQPTPQPEYIISSIQPYDMFPQTKHIETLVLISRKQ